MEVPTYLVHAILATLFCCMPLGVVGIVYAAKVGTMQAVGDYQGASQASDQARMWCWISFGCGLVVMVLYILMMVGMASQSPRRY